MLLVEAKAHDEELTKEAAGRRLTIDPCEDPEISVRCGAKSRVLAGNLNRRVAAICAAHTQVPPTPSSPRVRHRISGLGRTCCVL